ncbi:MAG TPA: glycosyltransferase [Blastocatellia bacterium]
MTVVPPMPKPSVHIPKVSVCIPTYNSAAYLSKAIDSVMLQEYGGFELIICDNASTDRTPEICAARCTDPRVKYLRYDHLVGQAENWNRCVAVARGEYIILLHADDILLPAYIRRVVALLDSHPEVGMVHSGVRRISEDGRGLSLQRTYAHDHLYSDGELFRRLALEGCIVNPAGVTVRRQVYQQAGQFSPQIVWGIDWHMWLRIALQYQVAYLGDVLALYREHAQSGTSGVMAAARNGADEAWVIDDVFSIVEKRRPELAGLRGLAIRQVAHRTWCFAEEMCRLRFSKAARAGIRRAIQIWPPIIFESRVWGLWAATYLGYDFFTRAHRAKNAFGDKRGMQAAAQRTKGR